MRPFVIGALSAITTAFAIAASGCSGGPPPAPAEDPSVHMHRHFAYAIALREVVVGGDLSLLGVPASELGNDTRHTDLPPSAAPFVEQMNHAARRAGDARTLIDGAQSVAEVAAACGDCHRAHDLQLTPSAPEAPPTTIDARGHMQRHHWATAKLWDGLVRPSWEDWKTGADALSETALPPEHLEGVDETTAGLARTLHDAGQRALSATPEARPAIFGEVIATCAGCHARRVR